MKLYHCIFRSTIIAQVFTWFVIPFWASFFSCCITPCSMGQEISGENALVKFALLHSERLRVIQAEYIVEEEKNEGKWIPSERHRVTYDFANGYFKQEVVKPPRNGKAFLQYDVSSWNGDRTVSISRLNSYNDKLLFSDDYFGIPVGAVSAAPLVRIDPFVNFYQGYFVNQTLQDYMDKGRDANKGLVFKNQSANVLSVTVNANLVFDINVHNGTIIRRTSLVGDKAGNPVKSNEILIEDSQLIDGLFFPLKFIFTDSAPDGVVNVHQRILVIKDSIKLNEAISKEAFNIQLPVGARINDAITKTVYTVTGVDEQLGASEALIKQLDKLLN
jgi:hypothetical protein